MKNKYSNSNSEAAFKEWLFYENFKNGIKPRKNNPLATYSEFPLSYRPGASPYAMPIYKVPAELCKFYQSEECDSTILNYYKHENFVNFPVHPVNLNNSQICNIDRILSFPFLNCYVSPTSSTRTVYSLHDYLPPHCIKAHSDIKITRWRRHMEMRKIVQAVSITSIFEKVKVFKEYPKVAYFPESMGAVFGGICEDDWGFIIREMTSNPILNHNCKLIPFCSLYHCPDHNQEKPILVNIIEESGVAPKKYLLEQVYFPLLTGWIKIYFSTGVLLEPHGQNVVVELNHDTNEIVRFVHRDFDCETNLDLAKENNIDITRINPKDSFTTEGSKIIPKGSRVSILFDNSIKVPLNALADLANTYFKISPNQIKEDVRCFLHEKFPDFIKYHLPASDIAYNYKDTPDGKTVVTIKNEAGWR